MMSPDLWASTPFGSRTALLDYYGIEQNFHRVLAGRVYALTGTVYRTNVLGDGGGRDWMAVHQREVVAAANALGIDPPVDLANYDLTDEVDWASFHFLNAQEHKRLQRAAGIV